MSEENSTETLPENTPAEIAESKTPETEKRPKVKIVLTEAAGKSIFFGLGMAYPEREFKKSDEPFELDDLFGDAAVRMHPEFFAPYQEIAGKPVVTKTDLNNTKIDDLKIKAAEMNIEGANDMKKADLVEAIWNVMHPAPPDAEHLDPTLQQGNSENTEQN